MDVSTIFRRLFSFQQRNDDVAQVSIEPITTLPVPKKKAGSCAGCVIDPSKEGSFYLIYNDKTCYYFNKQRQNYCEIRSMAINSHWNVSICDCASFKNPNNDKYYTLMVGYLMEEPIQSIFDFKKQEWQMVSQNNISAIQNVFAGKFTMFNDMFNQNIIHIAGGTENNGIKYGFLSFDSYVGFFSFFIFYFLFFIFHFLCLFAAYQKKNDKIDKTSFF